MSKIWGVSRITKLLLDSSEVALNMQPDLEIYEKNIGSRTDVYTNIDVQVEKDITQRLHEIDSTITIIGEETIHTTLQSKNMDALFKNESIAIDPIDGTQNFVNQLPIWAISIGMIENHEFKEGAIALPAIGEIYISHNNKVFCHKGTSQLSGTTALNITPHTIPDLKSDVYINYSKAQCLSFNSQNNAYYKPQIVGSCVYSIAKVLSGSYCAYIGTACIWDYAGCIGIFKALGISVFYYDSVKKEINVLPWKISQEYWTDTLQSRYPLIFSSSHALACKIFDYT